MTTDPDATAPRPTRTAGDYTLIRRLGAGGFGTVFEARHRESDLPYALERMQLSEEDADRFRKEALYPARVASQSMHVVSVHSFFRDQAEGFCYLVTELIPHGDLRRFLDSTPSRCRSTRRWTSPSASPGPHRDPRAEHRAPRSQAWQRPDGPQGRSVDPQDRGLRAGPLVGQRLGR